MANVNLENSKPSTVVIPLNYPMEPSINRLSLLFNANSDLLYHKFNPQDYDNGNIFGANQPYIYTYPTDRASGFVGFPMELGARDVVRITKFITSGRGILFTGKQFLLQGFQVYDETNLYQPIMPILATVSSLSGGILDKPKRHIDKSGGLLGGLASLVGIGVSRGLPPPSTVAAGDGTGGSANGQLFGGFNLLGKGGSNRETDVLPVQNYGNATGLLRAKTALKARSILQAKWGIPSGGQGGILGFVTGLAKSIFPQVFGSDKQNFKQRADEDTYDIMLKFYNDYTAKNLASGIQNSGLKLGFMGINILKGNPTKISKKISDSNNTLFTQKYYKNASGKDSIYDKTYFINIFNDTENSQLINDSFNEKIHYTTGDIVSKKVNDTLQAVIKNINSSGIYSIKPTNNDSFLIFTGNASKKGYDRLYDVSKNSFGNMGLKSDYINSVRMEYVNSNTKVLDSIFSNGIKTNRGFPGNSRPDRINTLTVLDKDKKIKEQLLSGYTEWEPYRDDLISFFFYDVVNGKYIPFRATIKGLSESNNALWEPLRFIGRADELYTYNGFTRNLSFTFTVVINSLVELYPTWKKINYLASSVKPSNYTKKTQNNGILNKFIIPPMFMITIGDLYKHQPIIITTVNINIPDSAIWETLSENSSEEWSYMADMIKSTVPKNRIGQMPREIEISITCNVLEKELPVTGGNHYGHCPVDENGNEYYDPNNSEYLPKPNGFSRNIRIDSEELQKLETSAQNTNLENFPKPPSPVLSANPNF